MRILMGMLIVLIYIGVVSAPIHVSAQYGAGGPPVGLYGTTNTSGTVLGNFFSRAFGSVLGVSTSTAQGSATCGPLLNTYMWFGNNNDPAEVTRLQDFLNSNNQAGLPVTGYFGPLTEAAVRTFQLKYANEVLAPWGLAQATGRVYLTTQRYINMLHCSALNIPMPVLQ